MRNFFVHRYNCDPRRMLIFLGLFLIVFGLMAFDSARERAADARRREVSAASAGATMFWQALLHEQWPRAGRHLSEACAQRLREFAALNGEQELVGALFLLRGRLPPSALRRPDLDCAFEPVQDRRRVLPAFIEEEAPARLAGACRPHSRTLSSLDGEVRMPASLRFEMTRVDGQWQVSAFGLSSVQGDIDVSERRVAAPGLEPTP